MRRARGSLLTTAPRLAEPSPTAVATLRITTVKTAGTPVETRAAFLRLGLAGAPWIADGQAYRSGVDIRTGSLDSWGVLENWTIRADHPDTHASVSGKIVPRFAQAVRLCERLHDGVPQFGIIGWDVTVDSQDQVKILEWNATSPSIRVSECMSGPNFQGLGWEALRS